VENVESFGGDEREDKGKVREATHASPSSISASSSPPARAKSSSSISSPADMVKADSDESAGLSEIFDG
jgi:hypothetical protein